MPGDIVLPHPMLMPIFLGIIIQLLSAADSSGELVKNVLFFAIFTMTIAWMRYLN
jgi:hypothetical protein